MNPEWATLCPGEIGIHVPVGPTIVVAHIPTTSQRKLHEVTTAIWLTSPGQVNGASVNWVVKPNGLAGPIGFIWQDSDTPVAVRKQGGQIVKLEGQEHTLSSVAASFAWYAGMIYISYFPRYQLKEYADVLMIPRYFYELMHMLPQNRILSGAANRGIEGVACDFIHAIRAVGQSVPFAFSIPKNITKSITS